MAVGMVVDKSHMRWFMKKTAVLVSCAAVAFAAAAAPVKIIFDTDMLTDFDDVGALACLHALADAGECEILATVSSTRGNASVGRHLQITEKLSKADVARVIDELMTRRPMHAEENRGK